jgi:A/G-specific adenine glycosylase
LSEIMLQQTTVATVAPLFDGFCRRFPDAQALAAAPLDAVLRAWSGLGYYARARNLHACAERLVTEHGGRLPDDEAALRRLPGIGDYTAAAIAAIAFDRPASPLDANVIRVVARLHGIADPLPGAKPRIAAAARAMTPNTRPGDFAQALMDLGAMVCTPRRPDCPRCPLGAACQARESGHPEMLPRKAAKRRRPERHAIAFLAVRGDGRVLLRRRPPDGLLGGMMELPATAWRDEPWTLAEALAAKPCGGRWRLLPGAVRHVFTHIGVTFRLAHARVTAAPAGTWADPGRLDDHAMPTMTRKLLAHGVAQIDARQ